MAEKVILVDEHDNQVGEMEKMAAHAEGMLHRAFSVFIFNSKGELLLQQRAFDKYHSGGKWTNTCCSHPRPDEETLDAANRRLSEEMGMSCQLNYGFSFIYEAVVDNLLSEHEYDHVYFGISDEKPVPDPAEVADFKYVQMDVLEKSITEHPVEYTAWLKICFEKVMQLYLEHIGQ